MRSLVFLLQGALSGPRTVMLCQLSNPLKYCILALMDIRSTTAASTLNTSLKNRICTAQGCSSESVRLIPLLLVADHSVHPITMGCALTIAVSCMRPVRTNRSFPFLNHSLVLPQHRSCLQCTCARHTVPDHVIGIRAAPHARMRRALLPRCPRRTYRNHWS
jgi:hypothetical protein